MFGVCHDGGLTLATTTDWDLTKYHHSFMTQSLYNTQTKIYTVCVSCPCTMSVSVNAAFVGGEDAEQEIVEEIREIARDNIDNIDTSDTDTEQILRMYLVSLCQSVM